MQVWERAFGKYNATWIGQEITASDRCLIVVEGDELLQLTEAESRRALTMLSWNTGELANQQYFLEIGSTAVVK